jgi:hypothetical protein
MQIKQIHSMRWAPPDQTFVALVADTDTGDNEEIATPYNGASIIWEAVQAFPVNKIADYVKPVPLLEFVESNETLQ